MAKIKIDKKILAELRTYFLDGGSTAIEDVTEQLNTDSHDVVDAYTQALRDTYPEDFPTDAPEEDAEPDFFLLGDDNLLKPLVIFKQKEDRVVFKIKEPEDKVSVLVRGTVREIDLYQLRKNPSGETHGVSNAVLISLGEIAKG